MKGKKLVVLMLSVTGLIVANNAHAADVSQSQTDVAVEQKHVSNNTEKPARKAQAGNSKKPAQQNKKPKKQKKQILQDTKVPSNAFTINRILVSIYTEEGSAIITQLDIEKPTLQGEKRTLDEMIFEKLVFLDAKAHKVVPDEEAVDRHLQTVQRENNLTLDQLKMIFKAAGYTYEEGREQFAVMSTVNSMIDYKIRSRLIVPEKDVVAYYDAHPEMQEPRYSVEIGFVPGDEKNMDEVLWGDPFWINKSEIAEDKEFIMQLKKGETSEFQEAAGGFEVYRLKEFEDERLKPLQARYKEISDALRRPRFEQLMQEYKKELFDNASIVYY